MTAREQIDAGAPSGTPVEEEKDRLPNLIGGFPDVVGLIASHAPDWVRRVITAMPGRYFEYDQWNLFGQKGPEYIVEFQNRLVAGGLLDPRDAIPGVFNDGATPAAARQLLIEATGLRTNWQSALNQRIEAVARMGGLGTGGGTGRTFVTPTYMAPDYATLSQAVKNTFAQLVGRAPKDYELSLLADQLASDSRREYEAVVAGQKAEFWAGSTPEGAGDEANRPLSLDPAPASTGSGDRVVGGTTVKAVDPMSRLREMIAARWGGEIASEEDEQEWTKNSSLMAQNLAGLSSVAGG